MATISDLSNLQRGSTWFGFTVTASGLGSTSQVYSMCVIGDVNDANDGLHSGPSFAKAFEFAGLTAGTTYNFTVVVYANGSPTDVRKSFSVKTNGTAPNPDPDPDPNPDPDPERINFSVEAIDITDTSVRLRAYGLPRRSGTREFVWRASTGQMPRADGFSTVSASKTSTEYELTGLDPETSYNISVSFKNTTDNSEGIGFTDITTLASSVDPDPAALWNWRKSNGAASADVTTDAYNAITNKGAVANFSFMVWNDLVDKVVSIQRIKGVTWRSGTINNVKYLTADNTKMSSRDKVLTADRFNSLRYNVGYYEPTGVSVKTKGMPVIGNDFIKITDSLNAWISK